MGEIAYEGDPSAAVNSTSRLQFEQGFMVGCYGLVEYSVSMSIAAMVIDRFDLYSKIGIKWIYLYAYVSLACNESFIDCYAATAITQLLRNSHARRSSHNQLLTK